MIGQARADIQSTVLLSVLSSFGADRQMGKLTIAICTVEQREMAFGGAKDRLFLGALSGRENRQGIFTDLRWTRSVNTSQAKSSGLCCAVM